MLVNDLQGKAVLVTGASVGIGAGIATAFGSVGARVGIHYNQGADQALEVLHSIESAGGEGQRFQADLGTRNGAAALAEEVGAAFGGLDVLINNAGSLIKRAQLQQLDDELFDQIMDLNVRSVVSLTRDVVPMMTLRGRGSIINISSIAARNGGGGGSVLYASAKAAISTFTRGMAKELAPLNIRVNALSPGVIATRFHEEHTAPAAFDALVESVPLGRAGTPSDIAGPTLFLASESLSGYVTGQVLEVNGGMYSP